MLGFTGYAFLLDKIIDAMYEADKVGKLDYLNFIALVLACVNVIFSILWIAMAKGSKAWYEVYESAIISVENSKMQMFAWSNIRCEIDLRIKKRKPSIKCEDRTDKDKFYDSKKNDNLFTTNAGGYSPSKINIVIGQIAMILWVGVLLTHLVSIFSDFSLEIKCSTIIILVLTIIILCKLRWTKMIKSSYFSDKKE